MRCLLALGLLAGCEVVFPLDEGAVGEVCAGQHTDTPLLTTCHSTSRVELAPRPDIDTGSSDDPAELADCDAVIAQGDVDGTQLCVIAAFQITIGTTRVHGTRPLMLVAIDELRVADSLSVASRHDALAGAGADFAGCFESQSGSASAFEQGAGGGAGGSFQTRGAGGGLANGNPGGAPGEIEPSIGFVRGGCRGGDGGHSDSPLPFDAFGGSGGGAMYLLAGGEIVIEGTLDASGAGGNAGTQADDTGSVNTGGAGGGGGGSGGMIALDAPMIRVGANGRMVANGGGGGGGGPPNNVQLATPGSDPATTEMSPFVALGGTSDGGGSGGNGATKRDVATPGAPNTIVNGGGGGGGGGGLGHLVTFGSFTNMGGFSPEIDNQ